MRVALLRVGIDSSPNTGGIYGPVFEDNTFEFIPIMDDQRVDERTYGNTNGQCRPERRLIEYFPQNLNDRMRGQPMHVDPEFRTFTYGDPTLPKRSLRDLKQGDMLVFYCGLERWPVAADRALYLIGYFEVEVAGLATHLEEHGYNVRRLFVGNFHVMHQKVYERERRELVLVKGYPHGSNGYASRLLTRAVKLSEVSRDRRGRPMQVLSCEMQQVFGNFRGHIFIQRGLHWVDPDHVESAVNFMRQQE